VRALREQLFWSITGLVLSGSLAVLLVTACGLPEAIRDAPPPPPSIDLQKPIFAPQISSFEPSTLTEGQGAVVTLDGHFFTDTRIHEKGPCRVRDAQISETRVRIILKVNNASTGSRCQLTLKNIWNSKLRADVALPVERPAAPTQNPRSPDVSK
jgi:hypothetical protein